MAAAQCAGLYTTLTDVTPGSGGCVARAALSHLGINGFASCAGNTSRSRARELAGTGGNSRTHVGVGAARGSLWPPCQSQIPVAPRRRHPQGPLEGCQACTRSVARCCLRAPAQQFLGKLDKLHGGRSARGRIRCRVHRVRRTRNKARPGLPSARKHTRGSRDRSGGHIPRPDPRTDDKRRGVGNRSFGCGSLRRCQCIAAVAVPVTAVALPSTRRASRGTRFGLPANAARRVSRSPRFITAASVRRLR